jgi:hypothetical protein
VTERPATQPAGRLPELYILSPPFAPGRDHAEVFRAVFAEACRYDGPVTVVAALVEMADQRFIKHIFYRWRRRTGCGSPSCAPPRTASGTASPSG